MDYKTCLWRASCGWGLSENKVSFERKGVVTRQENSSQAVTHARCSDYMKLVIFMDHLIHFIIITLIIADDDAWHIESHPSNSKVLYFEKYTCFQDHLEKLFTVFLNAKLRNTWAFDSFYQFSVRIFLNDFWEGYRVPSWVCPYMDIKGRVVCHR